MKKENKLIEKHLFVCTNKRANGKAACGDHNTEDLRMKLKDQCKKEFANKVRVNSAGCLGFCEKGAVACLYPDNIWYTQLQEQNLPEILQDIRDSLKINNQI